MMFTPTDELEDPIYRMDLYKFPSPLNYFELDGPIHEWINTLQPHVGTSNEPISKTVMNKGDMNCNHVSTKKAVSRRGASKGDRHSKIPTAHGLRDRRMRLSLEVARQFFKLQDMLSYDKPSKTVKWLLLQAKAAIEGLNKGKESPCSGDVTKCVSSNYSEGEVVESAIGDQEIVNGVSKVITPKEKCKKKRKNDQICPVGKESRKKAREEARERARIRTQEKKHAGFKANVGLGNDSVYETRNLKPTADVTFEIAQQQIQDERASVGFTQNWSSLMSLSYHQEDDNSCQLCFLQNPIPEAQQFQGTSSQPYNHPNLGHYWY